MIATKESKGEEIRRTTEAVLDAAVQFHEVDNHPEPGSHTKAMAWTEYMHALMNYHMAELAIFAGDQPASGVDCGHGPPDICRCLGSPVATQPAGAKPTPPKYRGTPPGMGTPPPGKDTPPTPNGTPHGL